MGCIPQNEIRNNGLTGVQNETIIQVVIIPSLNELAGKEKVCLK